MPTLNHRRVSIRLGWLPTSFTETIDVARDHGEHRGGNYQAVFQLIAGGYLSVEETEGNTVVETVWYSAAGLPISSRGKVSAALLQVLIEGRDGPAYPALLAMADGIDVSGPMIEDGDLQLALFLLYSLSYGSFEQRGDDLEWVPELIAIRRRLEARHEADLCTRISGLPDPEPTARDVAGALFEMTAADDGPSLAHYVSRRATAGQLREVLILRSIYTLREADPHSWAIPRLTGKTKAALIEIQADEYGGGQLHRMHSQLFADALHGAGLCDEYGAYLDLVPAVTIASHNTMSLFGLNRRLRGAIVGHLAAFEMTSSIPNRYYRDGFARAGFGDDVTRYFAEHVEADAVHEQIAGYDLAGSLAEQEPALVGDIMFGAAASLAMDALVTQHVLAAWKTGRSALRVPAADVAV